MDQRHGTSIPGDSLIAGINASAQHNTGSISSYTGPTFVFSLASDVTKQIIYAYQDFLNTNSLALAYRAELGEVNKEVLVMDQDQRLHSKELPAVVVNSMPVTGIPISFGNKVGVDEEIQGKVYTSYSGMANMSCTVELEDVSKQAVHKLADMLLLSMFVEVPDTLGRSQITIEPNTIQYTTASKQLGMAIDSNTYKITLSFKCLVQWMQYFEQNTNTVAGVSTTPTVE